MPRGDTYASEQQRVIDDHLRHIRDTAAFMVPVGEHASLRRAALAYVDPHARLHQ